MTTYLGPGDLKNRILPTGWDATELEKLRTESDITIEAIATELAGATAALNRELTSDPLYSLLWSPQTDPTVEYRMGSTNAWVRMAEYAPADEKRGKTEGHMLPLEDWVYPLGWTWKYLEKCRRKQIEADIQGFIDGARNKFQIALLDRFFQSADDSGEHRGLGAAGYSPGFAHDEASTEVDFVPPDYNGQAFANSHEHYNANDGHTAADWETAIEDMASEISEHGHAPPFVLMCAAEDQATIMGLTNFRERALPEIAYGSAIDLAKVSDLFFGLVSTPDGSMLCAWSHRIPQYYAGAFKAHGLRSSNAPLAVRYTDSHPLVVDILADKRYRQFPIEQLLGYSEFGVGVKDRTNGVCYYMNSASYSDPTIT